MTGNAPLLYFASGRFNRSLGTLGNTQSLDGHSTAQFAGVNDLHLARITLLSPDVFDIDIHEIPARGEDPTHLHYDVRYLMRAEAGQIRVSPESKALSWIALKIGRAHV